MQPHQNGLLRNPVQDHKGNVPKSKGTVRGQGASLQYQDPVDKAWKPAVRLADIRARLVREAPPSLYTHKKECGYDPTDVTTFIAKDRTYGGQRQHRPPLLFQIYPEETSCDKPTGYMKDNNKIVLDAFDHGIRDFPNVLPSALSSELAGHDIMYYFRQNEHIQLYDMIARMPNGYQEKDAKGLLTWHAGPPRYGTVGMRATRFRLQAGLLSWKKRMGSDVRNTKILSFIPDECKAPEVNSTQSFRDLTYKEQDEVSQALLGSAPGRKRNFKKNDKDKKTGTKNTEDEGEVENIEIRTRETGLGHTPMQVLSSHSSDFKKPRQVNNENGPDGEGDSDLSSDESGKKPAKRQRAAGSLDEESVSQNPFTNGTGLSMEFCPPNSSDPRISSMHTPIEISDDDGGTSSCNNNLYKDTHRDAEENGTTIANQSSGVSSERSSNRHTQRPLAQTESDIILGNDPVTARFLNTALINKQVTTVKFTVPERSFPDDRDFRWVVPDEYPETLDDNIAAIQAALDLTRVDFRERIGFDPPPSLTNEHKDQSYAMQHTALQQQFAQSYRGRQPIPHLYMLPKWEGSYQNWKISDDRGQKLWQASKKK